MGAAPDRLLGALPEALPWMDVPHVEDRYRAALISRTPQSFRVLRPPGTWLSFELYPDPRASASASTVRPTRGRPTRSRRRRTARAGPRCCTT
ncbi:hypothetical protein ACFQV4_30870 [Streptomyces thermocarboxydus]